MKRWLAVLLIVAAVGGAPSARLAAGDAENPPGGAKVYITLSGVTLHAVVQFLARHTGKHVVLPDAFPGDTPVDIVGGEATPVSADDAMRIYVTVLRKAGFTILDRGTHLEISPVSKADGVPVCADPTAPGWEAEGLLTTVIPVTNARAETLASMLETLKSPAGKLRANPERNEIVVTDYGVNIRSMLALVKKLDRPDGESVVEIYAVRHRSAQTLRPMATGYVQQLRKTAPPAVAKRLDNFNVQINTARNELVLFGHPDDIAAVVEYLERFDVPPEESGSNFRTYQVLYRDVKDLKETVDSILSATRPGEEAQSPDLAPQVIPDPTNNTLIVIAPPDKGEEIIGLIKQLDQPKAQVEIEAALIEVSTDKLVDLGIELNTIDRPGENPRGFGATTFGLSTVTEEGKVPTLPTKGGLTAGIFKESAGNIAALIRAAKSDQGISFIAAPRITTLDNRPATVTISEEREYLKSIVSPEGRTSEVTGGQFNRAEILLEITPHINPEGTVRLQITTQTDQFLPSTTTDSGETLTNIAKRRATTEVVVPNGSTAVIAGLTRTVKSKEVRGVPILSDIPVIRYLFRRVVDTDEERHLCIFITPRVHTQPATMAMEAKRRRKQLSDLSERGGFPIPSEQIEETAGGKQPSAPDRN